MEEAGNHSMGKRRKRVISLFKPMIILTVVVFMVFLYIQLTRYPSEMRRQALCIQCAVHCQYSCFQGNKPSVQECVEVLNQCDAKFDRFSIIWDDDFENHYSAFGEVFIDTKAHAARVLVVEKLQKFAYLITPASTTQTTLNEAEYKNVISSMNDPVRGIMVGDYE